MSGLRPVLSVVEFIQPPVLKTPPVQWSSTFLNQTEF